VTYLLKARTVEPHLQAVARETRYRDNGYECNNRGIVGKGPAAYRKDRPFLSSERVPHKNKTVTVKQQ
jgi:hypothetical protein